MNCSEGKIETEVELETKLENIKKSMLKHRTKQEVNTLILEIEKNCDDYMRSEILAFSQYATIFSNLKTLKRSLAQYTPENLIDVITSLAQEQSKETFIGHSDIIEINGLTRREPLLVRANITHLDITYKKAYVGDKTIITNYKNNNKNNNENNKQ